MNEVTTHVNGARSEDLPEFLRREVEKKEAEVKAEASTEATAEDGKLPEEAPPFLVDPK